MASEPTVRPLILLVGADLDRTDPLARHLRDDGMDVSTLPCGSPAEEELLRGIYDVVVLFACACGEEGVRLLTRTRAEQSYAECIVVAYCNSLNGAVSALKSGALEYHPPDVGVESLVDSVRRALDTARLQREVARLRRRLHATTPGGLVGRSKPMEGVFDLIERVAPTGVSVLVTGETGTGKELVSRAIHDLSPRRRKGFVPVSCATVPEHIMESLLFGHVRGAFTGAVDNRKGLFEHAPGGTVFLDEIDSLDVNLQAKLLRVLEERTIQRVGDRHDIPVDFRLITASNTELETAVERGDFREDLYYRLNTFPIRLPPLRERPEDIPLLAMHFRDRFAQENGMEPLAMHQCCMEWMLEYPWPGNVRELKHTVERAMLMSMGGERVTCDSLRHLRGGRPTSMSWTLPLAEEWSLSRLEREYIDEVLSKTGGHKGKAADILGIDRRTLYRKLDEREAPPPASVQADHAGAHFEPGRLY